jgi:L-threonylcarbamoyladenylate synthase
MKTELLNENDIARAAEIIKSGGLVAIPTETVYGLGANALDEEAVRKIFEVKGRPADNPLIIHVSSAAELNKWCADIPSAAFLLARRFWPGPLTLLLDKKPVIPSIVTAGLKTVAIRCPDHRLTLELIRRSGVPIAAPSANPSGKPSPTTAHHVMGDIGGKIEAVLDGGPCRVGLESTIVDMTVSPPRILRPGGVTKEMLAEVLGNVEVDGGLLRADEAPKAPGMKYRHYAPQADVIIVKSDDKSKIYAYINNQPDNGGAVLCFDGEEGYFSGKRCLAYGGAEDPSSMAERLFSALRELDREDIKIIYAVCPPETETGVGFAVFNRLKKAAGGRLICI